MKKLVIGIVLFILVSGCVLPLGPDKTQDSGPKTGFCGTSTYGSCKTDIDCVRGGCSNQVCHATSEDPPITTCEYRECYHAGEYGVECSCVNGQCRWE